MFNVYRNGGTLVRIAAILISRCPNSKLSMVALLTLKTKTFLSNEMENSDTIEKAASAIELLTGRRLSVVILSVHTYFRKWFYNFTPLGNYSTVVKPLLFGMGVWFPHKCLIINTMQWWIKPFQDTFGNLENCRITFMSVRYVLPFKVYLSLC